MVFVRTVGPIYYGPRAAVFFSKPIQGIMCFSAASPTRLNHAFGVFAASVHSPASIAKFNNPLVVFGTTLPGSLFASRAALAPPLSSKHHSLRYSLFTY